LRLVARDHTVPPVPYLRTSGGQFRDQMIHDFDAALWLLEPRAVAEVYATGSALALPDIAEFGDVDTAVAVLRFEDGVLCVIESSREAAYGYDVRAEILGSGGMFTVDARALPAQTMLDGRWADRASQSFIDRFAQAYRAELAAFVATLTDDAPLLASGEDAVEALRIAVAADRSFESGRPVRIAEIEDD